MKLLIVNKKRLGIMLILIGLVVLLFGIEGTLHNRLKASALLQNDIYDLKKYEMLKGKYSYKIPLKWNSQEKDCKDFEKIKYFNDFISNDYKIFGFVQLWENKEDIKTFIENNKNAGVLFKNYSKQNIKEIKINGMKGCALNYTAQSEKKTPYVWYEYYIQDGEYCIKFAFYTEEKNFKENMPTIFENLVETVKRNK